MFHITFSYSLFLFPSLYNSTALLPCHSLIFLSPLSFESPSSLSHFLVLDSSLVVLCFVCCDEPEAAMHVLSGLAPGAEEQAWGWANVALPYLFLPLLASLSPFSLSHLPLLLLLFTPLFPISLSMYFSLTLFACRLWEWWWMLGEWRNRYIASLRNQLYYLFFWCVCMWWLCVLLNCRWVSGFLITPMWKYAGGKGALFMLAASQCFLLRKE